MKVSFIQESDVIHDVLGFKILANNASDKAKIKRMLNSVFNIIINEKTSYGILKKKGTIQITIESPGWQSMSIKQS